MAPSDTIDVKGLINRGRIPFQVKNIADKVLSGIRISSDDAILLYNSADLGFLGLLASHVNYLKNNNNVYFNRNFHIEPTNICIYNCTFCSYRRDIGQEGCWEMSINDIANKAKSFKGKGITEVHITGGVHPKWNINYYGQIIKTIKKELPGIHVKAFSAVEIDYIIRMERLSVREGIRRLKVYGLDSIPGGGAEIADPEVREAICGDKASWKRWLEIHEAAHFEGLHSNATMLYGHIESHRHRVDHMDQIRRLQDKTKGFNCFIPLKFKAMNNKLAHIGEVNTLEDLRNFAVARIFLDNIQHIKAYWPMLGKQSTQLALNFGVDDVDGTIDDTTKIYSMAGANDPNPKMSVEEICTFIRKAGKNPIERDSLYNPLRSF
jgi:aminodeoxyfutalosine synthase